MNQYLPFSGVKKIAVLRATALGDFIFALPALDALRETYPGTEIVYLGRAWHAAFVPGRLSGPHRVIAFPPAPTQEMIVDGLVIDPAAEEEFFRTMRAERFDLALQMHGGGEKSNPFLLKLGARHTAGLKSAAAPALERWTPYVYYQNEVLRMLEVAALAGAGTETVSLQPRLRVLESDLQEAARALAKLPEPFVVIHPGSTDPRRIWSPQKFAAVADACAVRGLQVALTGTAMDAAQVGAIKEATRAPVVDLCGELTMPGLVGLLSCAALFIGNDSGPMHVALAVGAPVVGLFWAEYIVNSLPLLRGSFSPLIAWNRVCPACGRVLDKAEADSPSGACRHAVSFIEEITPAQVIAALEALPPRAV